MNPLIQSETFSFCRPKVSTSRRRTKREMFKALILQGDFVNFYKHICKDGNFIHWCELSNDDEFVRAFLKKVPCAIKSFDDVPQCLKDRLPTPENPCASHLEADVAKHNLCAIIWKHIEKDMQKYCREARQLENSIGTQPPNKV